ALPTTRVLVREVAAPRHLGGVPVRRHDQPPVHGEIPATAPPPVGVDQVKRLLLHGTAGVGGERLTGRHLPPRRRVGGGPAAAPRPGDRRPPVGTVVRGGGRLAGARRDPGRTL